MYQQLLILPGRFQPSTFSVCELNYRVRHGYGCDLTAITTDFYIVSHGYNDVKENLQI